MTSPARGSGSGVSAYTSTDGSPKSVRTAAFTDVAPCGSTLLVRPRSGDHDANRLEPQLQSCLGRSVPPRSLQRRAFSVNGTALADMPSHAMARGRGRKGLRRNLQSQEEPRTQAILALRDIVREQLQVV